MLIVKKYLYYVANQMSENHFFLSDEHSKLASLKLTFLLAARN